MQTELIKIGFKEDFEVILKDKGDVYKTVNEIRQERGMEKVKTEDSVSEPDAGSTLLKNNDSNGNVAVEQEKTIGRKRKDDEKIRTELNKTGFKEVFEVIPRDKDDVYKTENEMRSPPYPGKATHIAPQEGIPYGKDGLDSRTNSLIITSMQVTEGLKLLQQENEELRKEVQDLKQENRELLRLQKSLNQSGLGQGCESRTTTLNERLIDKQREVDRLRERLAAVCERKVMRDQRAAENNWQSQLEKEYITDFRDGKRVDAIETIQKLKRGSSTGRQPEMDHLKASRLARLVFEVSYECAAIARKNFTHISSVILDNLVSKAPLVAFIDKKQKSVHEELLLSRQSTSKSPSPFQDALNEVMVLVKETATKSNLDKLVQTVKSELVTRWRQETQQKQRGNKTKVQVILPTYDDKVKDGLTSYIEHCCKFSWRIVTQVPPLKIIYKESAFNPAAHVESSCFSRKTTKGNPQITCFLWPALLDCNARVIEKGQVVL